MNTQSSNKNCNPFAIINNIPRDYHSSDLRNFFSQFIETKGFKCFHFRHRPEVQLHKRKENGEDENCGQQKTSSTNTCCCVVSVFEDRYEEFYKMYHRKHWLDSNGESISKVCHISKVKIQNSDGKHFGILVYLILCDGNFNCCVFRWKEKIHRWNPWVLYLLHFYNLWVSMIKKINSTAVSVFVM